MRQAVWSQTPSPPSMAATSGRDLTTRCAIGRARTARSDAVVFGTGTPIQQQITTGQLAEGQDPSTNFTNGPGLAASDPCHLSRGARVGPRRRLERHVVERAGINAPVRAGEESQNMNVLILRIGAGVAAINDEVLDSPT